MSQQQANLLDQILSGQNRQLQVMAASGLVPLPQEQLIPIQVALTFSPDPEISSRSQTTLAELEPRLLMDFLGQQAGERELQYFATHSPHHDVLQTIIQRRDTPRPILALMASQISPDLQEILILRQDAILESPDILVELERNPQLASYTKRRIWEYREHLLPKEKLPPKTREELEAEVEAITEEDVLGALEEAKQKPAEGEKVDELRGLSDGQIRGLPVPIRVKIARGASRQLRGILIRDTNSQVALSVLNGNQLSDQEVEQIASSRSVVSEVLDEIPKRRDWIRKYPIAKALVRNPKTNLAVALRLVPRMSVRDLRELARDKNIADGVRSTALRLYQAKR